jgi:hypothetical protein
VWPVACGRAVPVDETLYFPDEADGIFRPFHMAHSDDYLFLTDYMSARLRVLAFGTESADGSSGMPVSVRDFRDLQHPRGMGFDKTTGTLLVACIARPDGVWLLDTQPPPPKWAFRQDDRPSLRMAPHTAAPLSIAMDEANGFVYVATLLPQTITQFGRIKRSCSCSCFSSKRL